jgi:ferredoxin
MRIEVDQSKCQGHSRCYAIASEVFDVDDYGQSHARNDGDVPSGMEEKVRLAIANCPEFAITVIEN